MKLGAAATATLNRAVPPGPEDLTATAAESPAAQRGADPPAPPAGAGSGNSSIRSPPPGPWSQATGDRSGGRSAIGP